MDPTRQPGIRIAHIWLERAFFEHRDDYLGHPVNSPVEMDDLDVHLEGGLSPDEQQGLIRMRIRPKTPKASLYNFDVTMAGIVIVDPKGGNMPLRDYFPTSAAALLYPFVREALANVTGRGRFGALWLVPINLTALTFHPTAQPIRVPQSAAVAASRST